jgi:hypothetical protein
MPPMPIYILEKATSVSCPFISAMTLYVSQQNYHLSAHYIGQGVTTSTYNNIRKKIMYYVSSEDEQEF